MICRSYLFVPGNRPDRFEKAWQSGADAVILDLEDAVQSAHKDLAREAVASWLSPARPVYVRINGTGTPWFERDLEVVGMPGVRLTSSWIRASPTTRRNCSMLARVWSWLHASLPSCLPSRA